MNLCLWNSSFFSSSHYPFCPLFTFSLVYFFGGEGRIKYQVSLMLESYRGLGNVFDCIAFKSFPQNDVDAGALVMLSCCFLFATIGGGGGFLPFSCTVP